MLLLFLIDTWTDATGSEASMGYQSVFAASHASLVSAQSSFPSHETALTTHVALVGEGSLVPSTHKTQPPATTPGFQVSPWAWRSCLAWKWRPLSSGPMCPLRGRASGTNERKAGLQPLFTPAATCFPHAAHSLGSADSRHTQSHSPGNLLSSDIC